MENIVLVPLLISLFSKGIYICKCCGFSHTLPLFFFFLCEVSSTFIVLKDKLHIFAQIQFFFCIFFFFYVYYYSVLDTTCVHFVLTGDCKRFVQHGCIIMQLVRGIWENNSSLLKLGIISVSMSLIAVLIYCFVYDMNTISLFMISISHDVINMFLWNDNCFWIIASQVKVVKKHWITSLYLATI